MAVLPKAQTVIVNSVQGQEDGDSIHPAWQVMVWVSGWNSHSSFRCSLAKANLPEAYYCAKSKNNAQRGAWRTQVGTPIANLFITDWEARIIFMDCGRPGSKHDLTHLRIPRAVPLIPSLPIFQVVVIITFKGAVPHVLVVWPCLGSVKGNRHRNRVANDLKVNGHVNKYINSWNVYMYSAIIKQSIIWAVLCWCSDFLLVWRSYELSTTITSVSSAILTMTGVNKFPAETRG